MGESGETQGAREEMNDLAVWYDGEDWVIASSAEDADRICAELYGSGDLECKWRKLPNDKVICVDFEDGPGRIELTCGQWIRRNGRGHLCSLDY